MQHLLTQIEDCLAGDKAGELLIALAEVMANALEEHQNTVNVLPPAVNDLPDLLRQFGTALDDSLGNAV